MVLRVGCRHPHVRLAPRYSTRVINARNSPVTCSKTTPLATLFTKLQIREKAKRACRKSQTLRESTPNPGSDEERVERYHVHSPFFRKTPSHHPVSLPLKRPELKRNDRTQIVVDVLVPGLCTSVEPSGVSRFCFCSRTTAWQYDPLSAGRAMVMSGALSILYFTSAAQHNWCSLCLPHATRASEAQPRPMRRRKAQFFPMTPQHSANRPSAHHPKIPIYNCGWDTIRGDIY